MNIGDVCTVSARAACTVWKRIEFKKRERLAVQRRICRVIYEQKQILVNQTEYQNLECRFVALLKREDQLVGEIYSLVKEGIALKHGADKLRVAAKKLR